MTASAHEEAEPAGTDPVRDEAERERGLAAYSSWWRGKIAAAIEAGVPPVPMNPWPDDPPEESGEFPGDDSGVPWGP